MLWQAAVLATASARIVARLHPELRLSLPVLKRRADARYYDPSAQEATMAPSDGFRRKSAKISAAERDRLRDEIRGARRDADVSYPVPMLERIVDGRTDLVFEHVANGNPVTAIAGGQSLIRWCAYYGDVSAIRFLVASGESLTSLGENFDLNGACFHGHWRLCEYIIENGADVNHALAHTGETPLHAALSKANRWKYTPVVKLLLSCGADPNRTTFGGRETGAFMRDCRTKGETALHRAAAFGNEDDIRSLLAAGAKPDALDDNGDSPLSWASWYLRPGAVLGLLCYGPFQIHPSRLKQATCEPATGSMESDLLGHPHSRATS